MMKETVSSLALKVLKASEFLLYEVGQFQAGKLEEFDGLLQLQGEGEPLLKFRL